MSSSIAAPLDDARRDDCRRGAVLDTSRQSSRRSCHGRGLPPDHEARQGRRPSDRRVAPPVSHSWPASAYMAHPSTSVSEPRRRDHRPEVPRSNSVTLPATPAVAWLRPTSSGRRASELGSAFASPLWRVRAARRRRVPSASRLVGAPRASVLHGHVCPRSSATNEPFLQLPSWVGSRRSAMS